MAGEFFTQFFGYGHENLSGEMAVRCPFTHDKGLEANPSAHVNLDKGVFHCKTCEAEGRPTGFSETGFVSHLYEITYSEAIEFMTSYTEKDEQTEPWNAAMQNLQESDACIDFLASRGLTLETAIKYKLGFTGDGVVYPVFVNEVLLDKRTYHFDHKETGKSKIASQRGASVLLFPFDNWVNDDGPTVLCAGENDTLLARQMGFNAVTSTMGEGSFPKVFLKLFKDREVFVCYDCDEAGKKSASRVAFHLYAAGARVRIVNLGLSGEKNDKDVTDFFLKHHHSAEDLYKLMQQAYFFNGEMYQEEKNRIYPLVPLWDAVEVQYTDKYISSRVMMMGKYETTHGPFMQIPSAVHFSCDGPKRDESGQLDPICKKCPLSKTGETMWMLNSDQLDKVVDLVELDDKTNNKTMNKLANIPFDCPGNVRYTKRDRVNVQRVIFAPDVESETELRGYRSAEIQAYVLRPKLEDGQRYRIFFKQYSHPKNHAVLLIVDRVEESDNAINSFHMTPEIIEQLSQFQGHPKDVMQRRFEMAKLVISPSTPRQVQQAVDILYHSVLDVRFAGVPLNKGYPEGAIVGESRTGKSETAKKLVQFYGLGNHTEIKNASVAGLIGGAESMKGTGYRIKWGKIPRNNRGLIILDEASGVTKEQLAHLTGVRSERKAVIEKIVSGEAPASTRLLWISNPRELSNGTSRPIEMYPTGVDVIVDLFGTDQDVARLDFAIVLPKNDVYIAPFRDLDELEKVDNTPYRNLVRWAWSRTIDQVKFDKGVEQYIWQTSQELNEQYDTHVKLFGAEAYKKLARIAVSIAVMCFSHDGTGDVVVVSKDHVDYARDFLVDCYDNTVFRLRDYVEQQRMISETTEEANNEFEKLVRTQPLLIKTLNSNAEVSTFQLQMLTGIEKQPFSEILARMLQTGLITATSTAISATLRFKKARDAYNNAGPTKMVPLSQQGRVF